MKNKNITYINKNLILISDYCKHGDLETGSKKYYDARIHDKNLCEKCSAEILNLSTLTKIDKSKYKNVIDILKDNNRKISEVKLSLWYPYLYKKIKSTEGRCWREQVYLFLNDLQKPPYCQCGKSRSFDNKKNIFRLECEKCIRSKAVKKSSNIKSIKKWSEILEDYFNMESAEFNITANYLIIKNQKILKKDIHFLKVGGILHESFINPHKFNNSFYNEKFKNGWDSYKNLNEELIRRRHPGIWYMINEESKKYNFENYSELKFLVKNGGDRPSCKVCGNDTSYNISNQNYNINCDVHKNMIFQSKGEQEILKFIKYNYKGNIISNNRSAIGKELDIYIPDKKLAIEYNGLYWHQENMIGKIYHYDKWKRCLDKNIKLFTIWEDDWLNKRKLIEQMLLNQLGLINFKIHARKCKIKEVDYNQSEVFLNNNHLQGNITSKIRLGLFYNNELVSLMTFGAKRMILKSKSKNPNEYELLRFCNIMGTSVMGGASKLFSYFIKKYDPTHISSYANCDISNGNLYKILRFANAGHTGPNFWWVKNGIKYHRSNFMKHKLVEVGHDKNKSASIIMQENGYYRIWGSGNLKFVYDKKN